MRKLFCILVVLLASTILFAQDRIPVNSQDKKEINGLTVVLKTAPGNSYLFDIMRGPVKISLPSEVNPATGLKKGFATREDAFKVAQWMISQYEKDKFLPPVVPPHVLDALKINKKSLYQN